MAEKPRDVFMTRMASSREPDPIRRVIAEFERDPEIVAAAVLELLHDCLGMAEGKRAESFTVVSEDGQELIADTLYVLDANTGIARPAGGPT